MRSSAFKVPSDEEMAQVFGSAPALLDPDGLKLVSIDDGVTGDRIELTYEAVTASVRCRWLQGETSFIDIYREGVTEMRIAGERRDLLEIMFLFDGATGKLTLRVAPFFAVDDEIVSV